MTSSEYSSGYRNVNGLRMYYEIFGQGKPLCSFMEAGPPIRLIIIIPLLSEHRQVIGVELQAHGLTNDRAFDFSFEQDAGMLCSY